MNSGLAPATYLRNKDYYNNKTNFTLDKCRALTEIKQGTSRVVLTADKGVVIVIMDKKEYTNKSHSLLEDTNTYRILNKDPATRFKNKLIQTLKDIKQSG